MTEQTENIEKIEERLARLEEENKTLKHRNDVLELRQATAKEKKKKPSPIEGPALEDYPRSPKEAVKMYQNGQISYQEYKNYSENFRRSKGMRRDRTGGWVDGTVKSGVATTGTGIDDGGKQ